MELPATISCNVDSFAIFSLCRFSIWTSFDGVQSPPAPIRVNLEFFHFSHFADRNRGQNKNDFLIVNEMHFTRAIQPLHATAISILPEVRRWLRSTTVYRVCVSFSIANKLTISTFAEFYIWIPSASLWCSGALSEEKISSIHAAQWIAVTTTTAHSVTNLFMGITYANRIANALFHKAVGGGGDGETMKNGFRSLC